jgi:hypothetical protein
MWQNLTQRGNFRNAPSACGGDRKFQGFASLLDGKLVFFHLISAGLNMREHDHIDQSIARGTDRVLL